MTHINCTSFNFFTKRTKYFSFDKTENRYKLLSAENLRKLSQNPETLLCLLPLGLKLDSLWKLNIYLGILTSQTSSFPLNITGVVYDCRIPFGHYSRPYKWFKILTDSTLWFQHNCACAYTNTHPYLHIT